MTDLVMKYFPIGIFALVADMMATLSGQMLGQVLNFVVTDRLACLLVIFIMQPLLVKVLGHHFLLFMSILLTVKETYHATIPYRH